jgi:Family of unknown function (DUF6510)
MTGHLDGNAMGGALGELFAVDVTTAVGECASCGTSAVIGEALVYPTGPGVVARCSTCGEVIVRLVRGRDRAWLDLRGVSSLEVMLPADA